MKHFADIHRRVVSYKKLGKRYYGPFEIVEAIGPVAYRLALPDSAKIHPPLSILDSKWDDSVVPPRHLVLVQWHGLPPEDTTWESWDLLSAHYHLEDKVSFQAVANDRNHGLITKVVINAEEEPNLTKNGPRNDEGVRPKRITKRPSNWEDYEH
ncbi:uncharacterized protein LOC114195048 [Vigna unguiculata]|uniref:uncharacterized protein LOC114195048 n=1 Tax=Vigna unguiculata TaxID=3917 RepID=UPI001016A171|nr:uncharacterized protein LOC114195048 [Vigna unguiculata]